MLASCGGGGASGGNAVSVVPGPTPTSTPASTPPPTSTTTPSPAYDMAYDLVRDRSFALNTAELSATGTSGQTGFIYSSIASALINPAQALTLNYVAATQDASVVRGTGAPRVYPQSQISLRGTDRVIYIAPDGSLSLSQPGPSNGGLSPGLRYVLVAVQNVTTRKADFSFDTIERRSIAGTSTVAADVPRTGTASYRVLLTSASYTATEYNGFVAQDATLTIDYAASTIRGTIVANSTSSSQPARSITIGISGQLSSTNNRLVGSVTSEDGGTGQFSGELYGTSGVELGLAFSVQRSGEQIAGTVVGVRRQ